MSLNLNAVLSSFIAASPRLIHHSKTLHWKVKKKKKKNLFHWPVSRPKHYLCEPSILIVVVVARAGLFTVRQIREWATCVFIYLFIFTLRYVIAPFRYLSRPLISAALAPALVSSECDLNLCLLLPVYAVWERNTAGHHRLYENTALSCLPLHLLLFPDPSRGSTRSGCWRVSSTAVMI